MNTSKAIILCILQVSCLLSTVAKAQTNSLLSQYYTDQGGNFFISPSISLVNNKLSSNNYLDSRLSLVHLNNRLRFKADIGFNQVESFEIVNPRIAVVLPNSVFISSETLRAHPSIYSLSVPVGISSWLKKNSFEFVSSLTILNEETVIDTPELITSGNNNLINWNGVKSKQTNFIISETILYNHGNWKVGGGISNFTLFKSGNIDTTFQFSDTVSPFLFLEYHQPSLTFQIQTYRNDFQFSFRKSLELLPFSFASGTNLHLTYRHGVDNYTYSKVKAGIDFPLLKGVRGSIMYHNLWGSRENFDDLEFKEWRESINWNSGHKVVDYLPNSSISFGIRIPLLNSVLSNIVLESQYVIRPNIFTSKLSYYTENPVAYVKVRNTASKNIKVAFVARSSDGRASYRSPVYRLKPNTVRDVPIHYISPFTYVHTRKKNVQYNVMMEINGGSRTIANFNLTLLGPNSWDGKVEDLSYFMDKDESDIRNRAKNLFIGISAELANSALHPAERSFTELSTFLNKVGKNIHYVNDQVYSYEVDQVQYPLETLETKAGDCEDIVVYLASHLRSLGHDVTVVDLRPSRGKRYSGRSEEINSELGHLFLLIDTNIPAELSGKLNLKDFSFLSRKNKFGQYTIWIPFETTLVDKGFNVSWKTGARQYYTHIIKNNGLENGTVKLVDF